MPEEATATKAVTINLDDLDWDALEEIETIVGHPITKELMAGDPSIRTLRALVLWTLRKEDPKITLDTMPDIRSMSVEIEAKKTKTPLASRRGRSRSSSASTE